MLALVYLGKPTLACHLRTRHKGVLEPVFSVDVEARIEVEALRVAIDTDVVRAVALSR